MEVSGAGPGAEGRRDLPHRIAVADAGRHVGLDRVHALAPRCGERALRAGHPEARRGTGGLAAAPRDYHHVGRR